jgi:hypothetical protein
MTVFLVILLLLVMAGVVAYVVDDRQRQIGESRQLRERLRVEHEQFLAEMRLQHMTQSALQHLLDEGRSPRDAAGGDWHQP